MFVTAYLYGANMQTVIPQKFIYELNRENLFNKGVNPHQKRRIFFSQELFDLLESGENVDICNYNPNFDLPITSVYPLPNGLKETCFFARLYKFWGE